MSLTKARGNMYSWVTHVWSPIKGCNHGCPYCYVQSLAALHHFDHTVRIEPKELEINLGALRTIFVGHLCDMWGEWVPDEWIHQVIDHCLNFPSNRYVFQTKNPGRFMDFKPQANFLYGTTIETDQYPQDVKINAPSPMTRTVIMRSLSKERRRFVTIEPIMEFNLIALVNMIRQINPEFVTIGADSKGHKLLEPSWEKVQQLIVELEKFTEIRQKTNLERLRK